MSVSNDLTKIADSLRAKYGGGQKLSLDMINSGINGLSEPTNYIAEGQTFSNTSPTIAEVNLINSSVWTNEIAGHSIVLSFDAKWTNFTGGRFGVEINTGNWKGCWIVFGDSSKSTNTSTFIDNDSVSDYVHCYSVYRTLSDEVVNSFDFFNQAKCDSFEIINPKLTIIPWGGGSLSND